MTYGQKDCCKEVWKPCKNFLGYMVSNHGRVYSRLSKKILKSGKGSSGYELVGLMIDTKCGRTYKSVNVHKLIAEAFLLNPQNLPTVDHIDRNKDNQCLCNLRWASRHTQGMNRNHRNRCKPVTCYTLEGDYVSDFTAMDEAAQWLLDNGWCKTTISSAKSAISMACNGVRETAYGFLWNFNTLEEGLL